MQFKILLSIATLASVAFGATTAEVDAVPGSALVVRAEEDAAKQAAALLASMPECGRNCLLGAIAVSPCETTDIACSCSNSTITEQVEVCVAGHCNTKQSLTTKNSTQTLCSAPVRDESHIVSHAGIAGGVLAVFAYILRMVSRLPYFGGNNLGWDDAIISIAVLEVIPLTVLSVILANLGLGTDIWTVPFENITMILKIYYYDEDLYLTALPLVKISILCFYLRVFPQQWFRISCFVSMAACMGYAIAFLLVSVFQCKPISYAWHNWDHEHTGTCNDINAQGWTSAALNVILDLVVLSLPIPVIAKLQLNNRKKLLILSMFGVGFVVTIVSILRLQVLVAFGGTTNFTWHYRSVGYWSTSELNLAIICACMPGISGLISWTLPRVKEASTRGQSKATSGFNSYGTQSSGPPHVKRSRPSRDLFDRTDKDFIPLVEAQSFTGDGRASEPSKAWPLSDSRAL